MGILYKGARVAVEVDGLLGVEEHSLLRVDLEDEILQGAQTDGVVQPVGLLGRQVLGLAEFIGDSLGGGHHLVHEVVGVDHRALTRLHLAIG